jgi:predicted DNA-binding protein
MKDVTLTIRIEEPLRDQFADAAAKTGRPVSQVVRELIRQFVASSYTSPSPLSDLELAERRMAVDFARANVELEGFRMPPDFVDELEQLARGEIDITDIHRETESRFSHLRVKP